MANENVLFAVFTSAISSALIIWLFYSLVMRVLQSEHVIACATYRAYAQYSVTQRLFHILFRGRIVGRIVLVVALVGLYYGAQFLGNDLEIAWHIYTILTQ